jgi:cobyrinic acid a,c-diamide synthase
VASRLAFVVGGTHSGCGKTTVALALMAAFQARGLKVQPFKIGPDFIDPGFHTRLTGITSRNLDGWMFSREHNVGRFRQCLQNAQAAIVEGVMGLYDGYDGVSEAGSSAEMAKWLGIPVILVVDARSMARSAAALVYGYSRFDPALRVAGVIFNRIGSSGHLQYLQTAMATNLPEVAVLGGIPRDQEVCLPERHLGLVMADELALDGDWVARLRALAEQHIDLDRLSELTTWPETNQAGEALLSLDERGASQVEQGGAQHSGLPPHRGRPVGGGSPGKNITLAVARDAAFCFYYADNFDALRDAGANLEFFSPLSGESLPQGAAGLYLGGGYPELHAGRLAVQQGFFADLQRLVGSGMPIYAECGGLMVLSRFITTSDGEQFPMAGLLPFGTRMLKRRKALGYTEAVVRRACLLGSPGTRLRGHEFHYSEIIGSVDEESIVCAYELEGRHGGPRVLEGYQLGSVLASYVHVHLGSAPEAAAHLVAACRHYREGLNRQGGSGDETS